MVSKALRVGKTIQCETTKIGKRPLEALYGNSQPIQVFDSGNIEAFELDSMPIDHFAQYRDRFTAPLPFDCH